MNWLAHLLLSEPTPQFRVGNVLADILPIHELRALAPEFQPGIARHREIDSFTDRHPIVRQSIARLDTRFRRYGGVIVDIFYDHLLTANWAEHSALQLNPFVESFHQDVEQCRPFIPSNAYSILFHMRTGEWLTSYGDIDGVHITLDRISRRLRRPFDLASASNELQRHYAEFTRDFEEFFPAIRARFHAH